MKKPKKFNEKDSKPVKDICLECGNTFLPLCDVDIYCDPCIEDRKKRDDDQIQNLFEDLMEQY